MTYDRPAWHREAACRNRDPAIWFPTSSRDPNIEVAKAICAACPVRLECRRHAITNRELHGVWGGLVGRELFAERAPTQRRQIAHARRRSTLTPDDVRTIKAALADGWAQRDLADRFSVSPGCIGKIQRGDTWADIA